jgi:nitrogen fixation NifU-like protein
VTADALYHQALVGLARAARGAGRLGDAGGTGSRENPLCGDRVAVDVRLGGGRVAAFAQRTRGCLLCEAAASLLGGAVPGRTPAEVVEARAVLSAMLREGAPAPGGPFAELAVFSPVREARSRHECVLLPFDALIDALSRAEE